MKEEIDGACLMLLLIDVAWTSPGGIARFQQTGDVLRREVVRARRKDVAVLPILVNGALMPGAAGRPDELRFICSLHAERLRTTHLQEDLQRIANSVAEIIESHAAAQEATRKRISAAIDAGVRIPREHLARMLETIERIEAPPGVGVERSTQVYGVWQIEVSGGAGKVVLRVLIGEASGSRFTGEYTATHHGWWQRTRTATIRGNWSRLVDRDGSVLLGIGLTFVGPDGSATEIAVPFHEVIGDALVGADASGNRYVSRLVEPRDGGF